MLENIKNHLGKFYSWLLINKKIIPIGEFLINLADVGSIPMKILLVSQRLGYQFF
jgi:hypothetical protein